MKIGSWTIDMAMVVMILLGIILGLLFRKYVLNPDKEKERLARIEREAIEESKRLEKKEQAARRREQRRGRRNNQT